MIQTACGGPEGVSLWRIARKAPSSTQPKDVCPRRVSDRSGRNSAFESSVRHSPTRKLSWLSAGFAAGALASAICPKPRGGHLAPAHRPPRRYRIRDELGWSRDAIEALMRVGT